MPIQFTNNGISPHQAGLRMFRRALPAWAAVAILSAATATVSAVAMAGEEPGTGNSPTTAPADPRQGDAPRDPAPLPNGGGPSGSLAPMIPGGMGGLGGRAKPWGDGKAPTEEEREKIRAFMQENMPKAFELVASGNRVTGLWRIQVVAAFQYRRLERVRSEHPDRHDLESAILDDAHSWDELGALGREFVNATEARRDEIRREARPFITKIVDNNLVERRERLESLKQSVQKEQERLDKDERGKAELVEKRLSDAITELSSARPGKGDRPPRDKQSGEPK